MPIVKPTQKQHSQKKALKLFAAGYRPLKNSAFARVGKFNYSKIRKRYGVITPYVLNEVAGVSAYMIDKQDVDNDTYYALFRLVKNATVDTYRILCEQQAEYVSDET